MEIQTTNGPTAQMPMTEVEAAARLCLAPSTLRTWRCLGDGPDFHKFGRAVRYLPADIDAYIAKMKVSQGNPS